MKARLTLCLVLLISISSFAQKDQGHDKTQRHQMDRILDGRPVLPVSLKQDKEGETQKVARLYRFRNARIKAELSFRTKSRNITV